MARPMPEEVPVRRITLFVKSIFWEMRDGDLWGVFLVEEGKREYCGERREVDGYFYRV